MLAISDILYVSQALEPFTVLLPLNNCLYLLQHRECSSLYLQRSDLLAYLALAPPLLLDWKRYPVQLKGVILPKSPILFSAGPKMIETAGREIYYGKAVFVVSGLSNK